MSHLHLFFDHGPSNPFCSFRWLSKAWSCLIHCSWTWRLHYACHCNLKLGGWRHLNGGLQLIFVVSESMNGTRVIFSCSYWLSHCWLEQARDTVGHEMVMLALSDKEQLIWLPFLKSKTTYNFLSVYNNNTVTISRVT